MAVPGAKPKAEGTTVHRNGVVHEWTEIPDVPFKKRKPVSLPRGTSQQTRAWWGRVTSLPHCVLWGAGDWQFALDTARIHHAFVRGDMARSSELRIREKQMGTTLEARRDLRIRYVDPKAAEFETADDPDPAVVNLAKERRERLTGAS